MKLLTIDQAIELILENKIVAVPTETVYGLFGLANSAQAVSNVYNIKNRPSDNPLICHFYSLTQIFEYVEKPPEYICKLIELVGPGSLTYVLQLKPNSRLAPACAGLLTVCCRIPDNELALALLQKINIPLFGPSANTSTKVSGVTAEMIDQDLGEKIAGIIDGGQSSVGLESTIIDTIELGKIKILRPGAIGKIELVNYLKQLGFGRIEVLENEKVENPTPGSRYLHYSPNTKIYLEQVNHVALRQHLTKEQQKVIGLKEFAKNNLNFISLGSCEDLPQVSAGFYLNLYRLDQQNIESCVFDLQSYEFIRDLGLSISKALFNRLEKVLS
jgi:L-threonylcarbamoyladenylate synthase